MQNRYCSRYIPISITYPLPRRIIDPILSINTIVILTSHIKFHLSCKIPDVISQPSNEIRKQERIKPPHCAFSRLKTQEAISMNTDAQAPLTLDERNLRKFDPCKWRVLVLVQNRNDETTRITDFSVESSGLQTLPIWYPKVESCRGLDNGQLPYMGENRKTSRSSSGNDMWRKSTYLKRKLKVYM